MELNRSVIDASGWEACHRIDEDRTGERSGPLNPHPDQAKSDLSFMFWPPALVLQSRIFLLTAVVAVDKLITIALGLADLVALLAVVEARVVLILMVPRRRWGRFRRAGDGDVTSRSYAATSNRSARSVMIVGCAILSILRSILVFLGCAVGRIVVFG